MLAVRMALPDYVRVEAAPSATPPPTPPMVSVVIPAYNEEKRIAPYLEKIGAYFARTKEAHEILVVNDGSRDGTAALVREWRKKPGFETLGLVHYEQNRGKGHAVRMGMRAAKGSIQLFTDADGSTPIDEIERLRIKIEKEGYDLAVGSRQLSSPEVQRKIKPHRYIIGQCFRLCRSVMLNVSVSDSQCGFKLCSKKASEIIFNAALVDGFAFDVEVLFLAAKAGMKIAEVPVNWQDDAASRVNLLIDPFKMLRDMARIRKLHRNTQLTPLK
jgi:dolichyl-phosphate beta-glucosyltransferase